MAAAERLRTGFAAALASDLNASGAMSAVFQLVKEANKAIEQGALGDGDKGRITGALADVDQVLGVLDPAQWAPPEESAQGLAAEEIEALLAKRQEARRGRDFATADRIRDQLQEEGIVIEDTPQGPRWRRQ